MADHSDRPDDWTLRAVEQARALRETVHDDPHLRAMVDVILFELGFRIECRLNPPENET